MFDFWGAVIRCPVDEKNDFLDSSFLSICRKVREVLSELNVPSAVKAIPQYFSLRPEERYEAVDSFRVTRCCNFNYLLSWKPSSLSFPKEFCPFLILKPEEDVFFKSILAARL